MKNHKIHHHASATLIPNGGDEYLLDIYDDTYPNKLYRNRAHLIGGNHRPKDDSPRELLEREIKEEFSTDHEEAEFDEGLVDLLGGEKNPLTARKVENFASEEDIALIRNALLERAVPYQDFLIHFPGLDHIPRYNVILSVYLANFPLEVFETARENLESGRSIKNEGIPRVVSVDELRRGDPLTIGSAGLTIGHYSRVLLPNPEKVTFAPLGMPRESFSDYREEFEYKAD